MNRDPKPIKNARGNRPAPAAMASQFSILIRKKGSNTIKPPRLPYRNRVRSVSPTNVGAANIDSGMMARSPSLRSCHRNAPSKRQPASAADHAAYPAVDSDALVNAKVSKPSATVARPAPAASSGAGRDSLRSSTYFQAKYAAPAAIGGLRRKIVRHPTVSTTQPPTTGPNAPARAPAAAQVPIARPRASPVNPPPRMARLFGRSSAAPNPCSARAARSHGSDGAPAHITEAQVNVAIPI